MKRGLFVGLVTLDLIYLADHPPAINQKLVASDYTVSAGGPATNAAVAFSHLGNRAMLLGRVGCHPMTQLVLADLHQCQVELLDLAPTERVPPPVSSIIVTQATGERAVISINAVKAQAPPTAIPTPCLQDISLVLIDGHQMNVGRTIARQARQQGLPVVVDGGSWKPEFEQVLALADYAICSANFHPPNCQTEDDTIAWLASLGVAHIAITHGEKPIRYWTGTRTGWLEVPTLEAVDTLGAGDIFHGAFCHAILQTEFTDALTIAGQVASHSCQFFGTRQWMQHDLTGHAGSATVDG